MLENGAYNVICHDVNPMRGGSSSKGRFLVRGVTVNANTDTNIDTNINKAVEYLDVEYQNNTSLSLNEKI